MRGGEKYRIGALIGGGGMAEVYRGQRFGAEGFQRPVAIKRILTGLSNDESFAKMFVREARLASLLTHPNIASVIDFDRDEEGHLFIVMELVEGKDLRALFESGPVPLSVTTYLVAELLRALDYAHRLEHEGRPMRLVHRDVSPHNVLLSWQGGVKLTDFGIAKALAESPLTQTGVVKGKAAYLAPEQAQSQGVDNRSDLFAVGALMHELLLGERLFGVADGAPEMVILRRVLTMAIPPPSASRPEISTALDHVCLTLLARDPAKRYPTAGAALEALLACPEFTARGQLELASLMTERFADEAPSESSNRPHVPAGRPRGDFTNPDLDVGPSSFTDIEALKTPGDFDDEPETELPAPPPAPDRRGTDRVDARPYAETIATPEADLVATLPEDDGPPVAREVGVVTLPGSPDLEARGRPAALGASDARTVPGGRPEARPAVAGEVGGTTVPAGGPPKLGADVGGSTSPASESRDGVDGTMAAADEVHHRDGVDVGGTTVPAGGPPKLGADVGGATSPTSESRLRADVGVAAGTTSPARRFEADPPSHPDARGEVVGHPAPRPAMTSRSDEAFDARRVPALRWARWYAAIAVLLLIGAWAVFQLFTSG